MEIEINAAAAGEKPVRAWFAWWRWPQAGDAKPRERAHRRLSTTRFIVIAALLGVSFTLLCAGIGYRLADQSDESRAAEQRAALRGGVQEFRALFGDRQEPDPRLVRMLEQSTGLKDLKFEIEPASNSRELQPVLDAQGRIAGFLTWEPDWPMTATVGRMLPLLAVTAFCLIGFAGFSLLQLRRARAELAESEEQARRTAEEDALTGLPNRRKMLLLLNEAMAARIGGKPLTFALFELSGLHDIDEEIGMIRREEFLADAVMSTKEFLPANATLGRMGTTEFAVFYDGDADARIMLRSMIRAIGGLRRSDTEVRIGAHAGYALTPRDATGSDELVRRARLALRAAGEKGSGSIVAFELSIDTLSKDQNFIRRELPRAVAAEAMELHYQPIVTSQGGRIVGVEALLRWTHVDRGAIPPATFIPVAEQMGLMDKLGAFVLRRALTEAKLWPNLYVAVNLSPLQVRGRAIVDLVRSALHDSGVAPNRLILEVTEGVLIDNPDEMVKRIEELRKLGVRIALDDFGSGYSNLGYLQRFPFDKLKIDKSFVSALGRSSNGGVIIQAIVALGRALGVTVLVEGVETEEQRVLLRLAGCDEMQGFLFARAVPAAAIGRLLAKSKTAPVQDTAAIA
ncbi:MAG: bifunctional diguanylate cyclase/phosphodiesterase [Hyphomicrobiales bacterium]